MAGFRVFGFWLFDNRQHQDIKLAGLTDQDSQGTPPGFKQFIQGEIGVGEGIANSISNGIAGLFK